MYYTTLARNVYLLLDYYCEAFAARGAPHRHISGEPARVTRPIWQ